MSLAVQVENITKTYGEVKALDSVSFAVEADECFGLLGPNGAGKSTLIRILSTIEKATSGGGLIAGMPIGENGAAIRAVVGIALQDTGVDPLMTGREVLILQARLFGWHSHTARLRADELLERFRLTSVASRLVRTYSGGMRRRLDLAVAIVHQPEIIVLDEPTTGLDPVNRMELWNQLRAFTRDEHKTVILTTQYLEEADALCSRVLFIKEGKIWAEGSPGDLKRQMGWSVVRFRVDREVLPKVMVEFTNTGKKFDMHQNDIEILSPRPEIELWEIKRWMDRNQVVMTNLEVHPPSLDEVFVQLMNRGLETRGEL